MRTIIRLVLALVLVAALGFALRGYWAGASWRISGPHAPAAIDTDAAKRRGAEIGETAARATAKVQETMTEAGVTAKIKAKMALDDTVRARAIDVTTSGTTVTLSGRVETRAELERAATLARETAGVSRVVKQIPGAVAQQPLR